MIKRNSTSIKTIVWVLLFSLVFTNISFLDVNAETIATSETTKTSEMLDDVAETTESEDLADSLETAAALTESETDEVLSEEITSDSESTSPENTVSTEETTSEETVAEESEPAEQPAPKEESATAQSNEDAQSDETKDSPAQSRRSRQSQVTRYIYANSIIRSTPNGSVITTLKMPLFVTGTIEGAWLKFTYNGSTAYVANSVTTTSNPPITGYAKSAINVRKTPGGAVIGTVIRGDQVKGVLVGSWVKFTYNGSTGYVYVPLLQDSPVEQKNVYIKAGSNLRDSPNGQVIEKLDMPIYVKANIASNWLYFERNNKVNYVYNSNTQTEPLTVTGYLIGNTNGRLSPDFDGYVFQILPIGMEISGTMQGDWVECILDSDYWHNEHYYVHIGRLRKDPIIQVRYAKSDTNLRYPDNLYHITGKIGKGDYVKGQVIGDYIVEKRNGMDMAVYRHILSETPIPYAGYVIPNTNVRNAPNGSVLGKYVKYTYVSGTWQDNWLKIQYQGKTGYVHYSQLSKNTPDQFITNQTSFIGADGTVVQGTPLTYGEMKRFLDLINQHRKNNGVAPLVYDYNWLDGGNIRAAEISYEFEHTRPDGSSWSTAIPIKGVSMLGENISWGSSTVEGAFERWKRSSFHNKNMLNAGYNAVMFTGITLNNGMRTWVTLLSRTAP